MLRAEELMVDDWIQYNDPYKGASFEQVRSILVDGITMEGYLDKFSRWKDIEPIPLTQEILEKNGFAKVSFEYAYNLPDYRSDIWFSPSTIYFYFGFDDTAAQFNCQYVHELQHALKLCGIEKEIVL